MDPSSKAEAVLQRSITLSGTAVFGLSLFTKHLAEPDNIRLRTTSNYKW